jgi:ATP-dependent RNA helicase RhlE
MPQNILDLSRQILINPEKVTVNAVSSAADTIKQFLYKTNKNNKKDLLLHILKDSKLDQVLLFSRTKHGADKIVRNLKNKNINCAATKVKIIANAPILKIGEVLKVSLVRFIAFLSSLPFS